jgi:hypothetical protein
MILYSDDDSFTVMTAEGLPEAGGTPSLPTKRTA